MRCDAEGAHASDSHPSEQREPNSNSAHWDARPLSAELPTGPLSELKPRTSQRYSGPTLYAVGRKAALESPSRDIEASINTKSNAAVAQFDCSAALNHADRTMILSHVCRLSPHLVRPFFSILSRTTLNLVRKEDGGSSVVPSNNGLTQGCPPTWATSRKSPRKDFRRTPPERGTVWTSTGLRLDTSRFMRASSWRV